jgi:hypothetical protein
MQNVKLLLTKVHPIFLVSLKQTQKEISQKRWCFSGNTERKEKKKNLSGESIYINYITFTFIMVNENV